MEIIGSANTFLELQTTAVLPLAFGVLAAIVAVFALVMLGVLAFAVVTLPEPPALFANKPENWGLHVETVRVGESEAWFVPHPDSERLVILAHGHNRSKEWMVPLIHSLSPIANVLAIDLPSHGSLWPGFCTFGVVESEQVLQAVRWAEQSGFHRIMVAGHSMGGSSSLLALTREPHDSVDGVATIGSYSSIESVFRSVASNLHLPQAPVTWILETASKIARYDYRRAAPLEHMAELKIPYLAVHGSRDALVPPQEAERLVSAAGSTSSLIWYDGGHDEPENPAIAEALVRFLRVLDDEISKPTFH